MNDMTQPKVQGSILGISYPKVDAADKVTGQAKYTADLRMDRMLHGKILRSHHPHANILSINTEKAERLPGVKAVLTWKDAPDLVFGFYQKDSRIFAKEKVRVEGDVIAAVAATDRDIAEAACQLIEVEYEVLPVVSDPFEAMKQGSILVHDGYENNIAAKTRLRKGDPTDSFEKAAFVFEDTFKTQGVEQVPMEPHMSLANYEPSGKFTIYTPSMAPFNCRLLLHKVLQVPTSKIRVVNPHIGGGFGGKHDIMLDPYTALLSKKSGRPVMIEGTREEEFSASTIRHPVTSTIKTAVTAEGKILARQIKLTLDYGGYSDIGEAVMRYATAMGAGPYNIDHVWVDGKAVYTNNNTGGSMRGIGLPQICFAGESQIDMIANRLGIDPYEMRMLNAVENGDISANGQKFAGIGYKETLKKAKEVSGIQWNPGKKKRGFGMASLIYSCGAGGRKDYSSAVITANEDGTFIVQSGAPDCGQSSKTTLAQLAAETIGARMEDICMTQPDTDTSPPDLYGAAATRITFVAGNAVVAAAKDVRAQILSRASDKWDVPESELSIEQGKIFTARGNYKLLGTLGDLIMEMHHPMGLTIIGKGSFHTNGEPLDPIDGQSPIIDVFLFGTQVAEVEVDTETGKVDVINIWAAHDVGKVINPTNLEGQVEGGIQNALGFALTEEIMCKEGRTKNASFVDYKMFIAPDMPKIHTIPVENPEPLGPCGARGVAEPATIPTAPAIANAVFDAIGVRVQQLPLTPERVLTEIQKNM